MAATVQQSRKVNIDDIDEPAYDDEIKPEQAQMQLAIQQAVNDAKKLLTKGTSSKEAISLIVQYSPVFISDISLEDEALFVLSAALSQVKGGDLGLLTKSLGETYLDNVMKYIYRALAKPEKYNSSMYLQWHSSVVSVAGIGSIVRAITERKPQ